jgi:phenylacetate-CoA ligase
MRRRVARCRGYHLSPDLGLVELIDPKTGELVPDGHPGEIVFTPLNARGTVVLRYRTGDIAEGGLTWEKCPNCGRTCPRLLGPISRVSEVKELHMDKLKGTLVNFNVLEHLLDDQRGIAAWQIELRKRTTTRSKPTRCISTSPPSPGCSESDLELAVTRRFHEATEITPNELHFHTLAEMREHLGIGRLLKEEKIADHRPKAHTPILNSPSAHENSLTRHRLRCPHAVLTSGNGSRSSRRRRTRPSCCRIVADTHRHRSDARR